MLKVMSKALAIFALCVGLTIAVAAQETKEFKLVSKFATICADIKGGNVTKAHERILAYGCHNGANQNFKYNTSTKQIKVGNYCLDSGWQEVTGWFSVGKTDRGSEIVIEPCNSSSKTQKWNFVEYSDGYLIQQVASGRVIDIEGGEPTGISVGVPFTNWTVKFKDNVARLLLWDKNNGDNQKWLFGVVKSASDSTVANRPQIQSGIYVDDINKTRNSQGQFVATNSGTVIATGGGNVIATGGGNVIAVSGANVISTDGAGFAVRP